MRSPLRRQEAPKRQRHADHHGFVQHEQHEGATKDFAQQLRRLDAKQQGAAQLRNRRRAQRQHQAEDAGQREHADAQGDPRTRGQSGDAQHIKTDGDARACGRKTDQLFEGVRRTPERIGRVTEKGKKRDGDKIDAGGGGLTGQITRRPQ